MKIKLYITCLLIPILFSSCTQIVMLSYGVRNPKIETKQSITKYLESIHLATRDSYAFRDTSALYRFFTTKTGFPEIVFYDRNGYLMLYRDEKKCNGQNSDLISFLDPQNNISVDSAKRIADLLEDLRTLDGHEIDKEDFQKYDFYMVTYWAKWSGKTNKTKISEWEKTLKIKNNPKIKSIKVSIDFMDFWRVGKEDLFKVYTRETRGSKATKSQNKSPE